jgi:hypothetical protein
MSSDGEEKKKTEWGEEVLPGVYLMRGSNQAAAPLVAAPAPVNEMDLKVVYEKIDAAEFLRQRLISSNEELIAYFSAENEGGEESDDEDEYEDAAADDDDEKQNEEEHFDPNSDGSGGGGGINDMNSLLAMDAENAQEEDSDPADGDDEDRALREKQKREQAAKEKKRKKKFDGANPNPTLLASLPADIREAIVENLEIIAEKQAEIVDLINMSAARQHKCGQCRVHGAPPPDINPL